MTRMKDRFYRFPANRRAQEATLKEQLLKVCEEAREAWQAYADGEPEWRIIEELEDAHQAIEGAERKFKPQDILVGRARVRIKCRHRGDYVKWEGK